MRPELRSDALLAIAVAGAIGGLAQALPVGVVASCCCTQWSLIGSIFAVLFVVHQKKIRLVPAEGAVIGLGVGAITGVIGGILGALRSVWSMDGMLGAMLRDRPEGMGFGLGQHLWGAIVVFLLHVLFGLALGPLGGWLASLFVKPPASPSPPPSP